MHGREALSVRPWTIFVVALAIMFFRMPDRFIHGYLWAEDGPRMLQEVANRGRHSLFATWPGYSILIPKLISYVSMKIFRLGQMPWIFVYAAALAWAAMCGFTFKVASKWLGTAAAVALALYPVLAPHTGEVFLNLTNFQWLIAPCLAACLWVAAKEKVDLPVRLGTAIFLLSATGPFSVLMLPFVIALYVMYRPVTVTRKTIGLALAYVVPVIFQAWHMLKFSQAANRNFNLPWFDEYMVHAVADQMLGTYVMAEIPLAAPWVGVCILAFILALVLTSRAWLLCLSIIAFATAGWVLAMLKLNAPGVHLLYDGNGSRYVYPMAVALFSAIVIAASTTRVPRLRYPASAIAAIFVLTGLTAFTISRDGMRWSYSKEGAIGHMIVPPAAAPGQAPWEARIRIRR